MPERRILLLGSPNDRIVGRLEDGFAVTRAGSQEAFEAALQDGAGIEGIGMLGHWVIDASVMDRLPNLKIVSNFGVGYDTIDAEEAAKRGIIVSHTPEVLNEEVADTALMLWLAVSRELLPSERWARSGDWEAKGNYPLTRTIRGRKVGIVGLGRIGQAIADHAEHFGAEVLYHSRSEKDVAYRYFADLTAMAKEADVLIVITPGGPETKHLIDGAVLSALGPDGILINVARGTVVDEAALVEALEAGWIRGAGLDVFEEEPKIHPGLKGRDDVVLLPHVGSGSVETRDAMGDLMCENLELWRDTGKVRTPVPECRELNG